MYKKRNVRKAAYFIGGKLLKRSFDYNFCNFFIQRLCVESNKYVLSSILDRFSEPHKDYYDWQVENGHGYVGDLLLDDKKVVIKNIENL